MQRSLIVIATKILLLFGVIDTKVEFMIIESGKPTVSGQLSGQAAEEMLASDLLIKVQADTLQLLFRQSFPAIFVSLFNAILLIAMLWSVQNTDVLLGWFAVLIVASLARLVLFIRYQKIAPQGADILRWERPYFITLVLSSIIWGVGCVLIMPAHSALHQAIVFFILIGMAGGAVSVYSAHRAMTLTTMAILLLPTSIYFLLYGDYIFGLMVVAAIMFFTSAIRTTAVLSDSLQQTFTLTHELKASRDKADRVARVDELTGLLNRRAFYEYGKLLTHSSQRKKEDLAMIMMDLDNFKRINDSFGHAAGDVALKKIGEILHQRLRKSDVFARIGGEEFALLLPQTSLNEATELAEKLRQTIADATVEFDNEHINITASFGVSSGLFDIDALARQADAAMYQSKDAGRNKVTSAGNDTSTDH